MPKWNETVERIAEQMNVIAASMQKAVEDMARADKQGKGFAGRLTVARMVAQEMADPSKEILDLGNDFATQLHTVDIGIRAIIDQAPASVEQDSSSRSEICEFFGIVRELSRSAHEGLGMLQQMIDAISPMERMSRDLRPASRGLRQGLTLMLEGMEVTDEWVKLIDGSPVSCPDAS